MGAASSTGLTQEQIIQKEIERQKEEQAKKSDDISHQIYHTNSKSKSKCQKPQEVLPQYPANYIDFDSNSKPIQENSKHQERVLKKIIPGQDGRTIVESTREWPHSVHGMLSTKFEGRTYTGTATMIGPGLAITAAHNLYDCNTCKEVKASDLLFYPGLDRHLLPFGVVKVLAFYYPEEYKAYRKEDYAILILEKDIGYQTGFFGLCALEKSEAEKKKINITGYPGDKVADKPKCHEMWSMKGPVSHIDDHMISYEIDTYAGQSGSGIWYDEGDEHYIIGVHVQGSSNHNQGIFLNKERFERIKQWTQLPYPKAVNVELQKLNLYSKQFGVSGAKYLSKASLSHLIDLEIGNNLIGDKGLEFLSKANFPELQHLGLVRSEIGDKGVKFLSKANFPQLQSLNLSKNGIGDRGAEFLSRAHFPKLQSLELSYNNIEDRGAEFLSRAYFPQLHALRLSGNLIGAQGAEFLSKAQFLQLQLLQLDCNKIGDKGAEFLSKSNFPQQLEELDLGSNFIGDKGAECLSKADFPRLKKLILSYNQIGDIGAESLSKSNFPQLNALEIKTNQIGQEGAKKLILANFPKLQELQISSREIGPQEKAFLMALRNEHSLKVNVRFS